VHIPSSSDLGARVVVKPKPHSGGVSVLYGVTLEMAAIPERIAYARSPRRLPVVVSAGDVLRFLKARTALTTTYAAGLGVSEVTGLRVADIDSSRSNR